MRFSEILPSKSLQRIIIIVLACIIVGLVIFTAVKRYNKMQEEKRAGIEVAYIDSNSDTLAELDDDGDGVPNWEERLWGLDPYRADTDSDGVSDLEYVESKKRAQRREDLGIDTASSGLTSSEELSRGLYTAILAIEQAGGVLDAETGEKISDNIVEYIESISVGGELYLRENLKLVPNTKENVYGYRDKMNVLLTEYPLDPNDLELIAQAVENRDAYKTKISRLSDRYAVLLGELAQMNVPYAIAGRHTEFLNSIAHISGTFKNLNQPEVDEIELLSALVQMQEVLRDASTSVYYINLFFEVVSDESLFE